jgi:adenine deaminase
MNLEDHIGDIIRKGRAMSGVEAEAAARAAGLTAAELAGLEESGRVPPGRTPDFGALAGLLGLHPAKL